MPTPDRAILIIALLGLRDAAVLAAKAVEQGGSPDMAAIFREMAEVIVARDASVHLHGPNQAGD